jgi:hypothetical protein
MKEDSKSRSTSKKTEEKKKKETPKKIAKAPKKEEPKRVIGKKRSRSENVQGKSKYNPIEE